MLPHHELSEGADDSQLVTEVKRLIQEENRLLSELLSRIAQIDERRIFVKRGFPSMFAFLTGELHLSEGAAYKRLTAARAARRFPLILDMVAEGQIHLSSIAILGPVLTEENHENILRQAVHRSKRDIERLHALYLPRPDVPDLMRRLPDPPTLPGESWEAGASQEPIPPPSIPVSSVARRERTSQLSEARVKFQFTGGEGLRAKVERARELLRHKHPEGRLEDIFEEALEAFLEKRDPERKIIRKERKRGHCREEGNRPVSGSRSRRIPQGVKEVVWRRDEGRCRYVSPEGRRCEERGMLEFHHVRAFARGGGSSDVGNVQLLCRAHNQHLAREEFGERAVRHKPG